MLLKPAKNFTKESHIYIRLAKFHTPIAENATSEATYSYEIVANTHGFDNCKLLLSVVREKRSFQGNLIKGQGILWKLSGTKIFTGVKLPRILVSSFAILNFKRRRKVNVLDLVFFLTMLSTAKQMENVTCKTSLWLNTSRENYNNIWYYNILYRFYTIKSLSS